MGNYEYLFTGKNLLAYLIGKKWRIAMDTPLAQKRCTPCSGAVNPLKGEELAFYQKFLSEGWQIIQEHHLEKEYRFKDFKKALEFTNLIGILAENEGHHPDLFLSWGKVKLCYFTHKMNGLSENDFIMAVKSDQEYQKIS